MDYKRSKLLFIESGLGEKHFDDFLKTVHQDLNMALVEYHLSRRSSPVGGGRLAYCILGNPPAPVYRRRRRYPTTKTAPILLDFDHRVETEVAAITIDSDTITGEWRDLTSLSIKDDIIAPFIARVEAADPEALIAGPVRRVFGVEFMNRLVVRNDRLRSTPCARAAGGTWTPVQDAHLAISIFEEIAAALGIPFHDWIAGRFDPSRPQEMQVAKAVEEL